MIKDFALIHWLCAPRGETAVGVVACVPDARRGQRLCGPGRYFQRARRGTAEALGAASRRLPWLSFRSAGRSWISSTEPTMAARQLRLTT